MVNYLKIAFWCGLLALIFSVVPGLTLGFIMNSGLDFKVISIFGIIFGIINLALWGMFIYGFVKIGKKHESNFLRVLAWIGLILMVLGFALMIPVQQKVMTVAEDFQSFETTEELTIEQEQQLVGMLSVLGAFFLYLIIGIVITSILSILGGVAWIKLDSKIKYAKVTGILKIVAGATYIIIIGFLIRFVVLIFELIIMHNEGSVVSEVLQNEKIVSQDSVNSQSL